MLGGLDRKHPVSYMLKNNDLSSIVVGRFHAYRTS